MVQDEGEIVAWATNESGDHYPIHAPEGDAQGNLFTGKFERIVGKSEKEAAEKRQQAKAEAAEKRKEERAEKAVARQNEREARREEARRQRETEREKKKQDRESQKLDRLRAKEAAGTLTAKEKEWLEENDIPAF